MFCPQCGTKIDEPVNFCPECGENLIGMFPENRLMFQATTIINLNSQSAALKQRKTAMPK